MLQWELPGFGLQNLRLTEASESLPAAGEVRVRLRASSLNFRDTLMIAGRYNPHVPLPLIPLSDGAGEVIAVGEGVTRFRTGDRVAAQFAPGWIAGSPSLKDLRETLGGPLPGTLIQERNFSESALVAVPDYLSFEEAATLPCAAVTAWSALFVYGNLHPGDTVVVLGTGGVSVFALQFARLAGARVIVTSSSDSKLAKMKELGADEGINYTTSDWSAEVYRLTHKRGADFIIETGGAGTFEASLRAVRPDGTISMIGVLAGNSKDLNLLPVLMKNIRVQGILVGSRQAFEEMMLACAAHKVRPLIDRIFPFDKAPAAVDYLKSQQHTGKVVISHD